MGSKYPRSVRCCLPLWTLTLEVALILVFFFTSYDNSSKDRKKLMGTYGAIFQDITVMAALGLGFLTSSLWRHGWSSVAFNLLMLALGVQWAVLLDGFLVQPFFSKAVISLSRIQKATMSTMSVLISAGAVLGKTNLVQLMFMTLMEVTVFGTMRLLFRKFFFMEDHISMMHIHVFAACFGLTVAWCLPKPLAEKAEKKDQMAVSPSLFAMLGTLFLWMFWPSFNSTLLNSPNERKNAMFNTYYALSVSAVTAISVSALAHPQGKINMTHIHNAVLAGGVAVGASCHLIPSPWLAMVLGLLAGLISIGGVKVLPVLRICDTCSVHSTFGLPGLLGLINYIVLMTRGADWTNNPMVQGLKTGDQVYIHTGALSLSITMGLASGFLTGLLLKLKIWRGTTHTARYFDDQAFWKFPHLAVGF